MLPRASAVEIRGMTLRAVLLHDRLAEALVGERGVGRALGTRRLAGVARTAVVVAHRDDEQPETQHDPGDGHGLRFSTARASTDRERSARDRERAAMIAARAVAGPGSRAVECDSDGAVQ